MKKIILGIIATVVFIIIGASVFLYYTEKENQTALDQMMNLWDSSVEKYSQAIERWDENDYAGARIILAGAKTDVDEGRKHLEQAELFSDEHIDQISKDQKSIQFL